MYELLIADDETSSHSILASCFPWEEQGFHICVQIKKHLNQKKSLFHYSSFFYQKSAGKYASFNTAFISKYLQHIPHIQGE